MADILPKLSEGDLHQIATAQAKQTRAIELAKIKGGKPEDYINSPLVKGVKVWPDGVSGKIGDPHLQE